MCAKQVQQQPVARPHSGFHFITHFARIFLILNRKQRFHANIAFVLFLSIVEEVIIFQIGLVTAKFYYILLIKDVNKFYVQLATTLALVLFFSLVKSAKSYTCSVLNIEWREQLSKWLFASYFDQDNFYHLNHPPLLDNVDQRFSQDLDKLCAGVSQIIPQIVTSPLVILYYSWQVYTTIGLFGVVSCLLMFLLSTLANKSFVNSIFKWTYRKGKYEGDYRTAHNHVKQFAENIVFAGAQQIVHSRLTKSLQVLLSVHENLILKQFFLNCATTIFDYSGSLVAFVIIAIPIFNGSFGHLNEAELSRQISANTFICLYLINSFSKLINISSNLADINGFGLRITEMIDCFNQRRAQSHVGFESLISNEDLLHVNLTIPSQNKDSPVKLSFRVTRERNVFVHSHNSIYILKCIRGLEPIPSDGSIESCLDLNDIHQVMIIAHDSQFADFYLQVCIQYGRSDFLIKFCSPTGYLAQFGQVDRDEIP